MADPTDLARAETEASAWFTRLKRTSISTDDLYAFRDWRQEPGNAAAFSRVERAWKRAAGLRTDPDIKAETEAALRKTAAPRPMVRWEFAAPIAVALAVTAATGVFFANRSSGPTYATAVGEQRLVPLEDGSQVRLNTDSAIRVAYRKGERRVELTRGEAFFDVAHDVARPFVVMAGDVQVKALGTRFDVRRSPVATNVTLVQGRVQVANGSGGAVVLSPNQQLSVTKQGISPARPADVTEIVSWTTGRLSFRDMALKDAVAEVNRYGAHKIVLQTTREVANEPVSGEFNVGDTQAFVTAVTLSFALRSEVGADGKVHLVSGQP